MPNTMKLHVACPGCYRELTFDAKDLVGIGEPYIGGGATFELRDGSEWQTSLPMMELVKRHTEALRDTVQNNLRQ